MMRPGGSMHVDIWSDIVCPWCYLGKCHLEQALASFEHRDEVTVRYRSFELDPSASCRAREAEAGLAAKAVADGLEFTADRAMGNTFDAHRLVHFAADHGMQGPLLSRLYQSYFGQGRPVFAAADLVLLAAGAGLDPGDAARVLDDGSYSGAVRADEAEARTLGISGVPFFVIDRRYGISGAQPAQALAGALQSAWDGRVGE